MKGFQSPNHTQTPNDLFDDLMKTMTEAELKVVLAVIRGTFGWHREKFELSVRKMAEMTGLSPASVQEGARRAEERGLIERATDGQNSTVWRAVVSVPKSDTPVPNSDTEVYQGMAQAVSKFSRQLGLKKDKEKKEIYDLFALLPVGLQTEEFITAWGEWICHRWEMKRKLTPRAARLQLDKLERAGAASARLMIEQSIEQGWQGLFPLKENYNGNGAKPGKVGAPLKVIPGQER
jgi:DNA-binding Lrp family transcriptional regulator